MVRREFLWMNNLEECVSYFKSMSGFDRFMNVLKDKFIKSGKITGYVYMEKLSSVEARDLSKFFGLSLNENDIFRVSIQNFRKIMCNTKFGDIDPYKIVTTYFDVNEFITKKSKKKKALLAYIDFLNDILGNISSYDLLNYLSLVLSNKNNSISKSIKRKYNFDKNELREFLLNVDSLLMNVPVSPTSIPMYASITGNPHFLDFDTGSGNMFIRILGGIKRKSVDTLEDKLLLLESINVYNDTLSNSTITFNLLGDKSLESFNSNGPVNLNLDNISHFEKLYAINNKVFIFENPSMLNYFKSRNISIIITSGIPNLSFYRLIEKFDDNTLFYYNGDFDPEGLVIANKIKHIIPNVNLFCYSEEDYYNTKPCLEINLNRIHKLDGVNVRELECIKNIINIKRVVGYQESNLKNIESFIDSEMCVDRV